MRASSVVVASIVALSMSAVLAPAFARGGGGFGRGFVGHPMGFHAPVIHAPVVRPLAQFHQGLRGLERRRLGLGYFPFGGTYLGGGYGPTEYVEPVPAPAAAEPEITGAIAPPPVYRSFPPPYIPYRAGCTRETVDVPSESGGEREIHIIRC
jgi:hypothetical protein